MVDKRALTVPVAILAVVASNPPELATLAPSHQPSSVAVADQAPSLQLRLVLKHTVASSAPVALSSRDRAYTLGNDGLYVVSVTGELLKVAPGFPNAYDLVSDNRGTSLVAWAGNDLWTFDVARGESREIKAPFASIRRAACVRGADDKARFAVLSDSPNQLVMLATDGGASKSLAVSSSSWCVEAAPTAKGTKLGGSVLVSEAKPKSLTDVFHSVVRVIDADGATIKSYPLAMQAPWAIKALGETGGDIDFVAIGPSKNDGQRACRVSGGAVAWSVELPVAKKDILHNAQADGAWLTVASGGRILIVDLATGKVLCNHKQEFGLNGAVVIAAGGEKYVVSTGSVLAVWKVEQAQK